jgi:hypothetical protein
MGKHRSKEERLEERFAEMRELQRLKRESAAAGAVSVREQKRHAKQAERAGAAIVPEPAAERPVGFTWGKPLPRRSRDELKRIRRNYRRKKHPPKPKAGPKCGCGDCPECARRKRHTEYVRKRRAEKADG